MTCGLFIGISTLDLIYLVESFPNSNQKLVALEQTVAAGGPATNAAVAFGHLGNQATIIGVVGNHPISSLIKADLEAYSVNLLDLNPSRTESPPVSSIIVTQSTGDRAVISLNATKFQASAQQLPPDILQGIDVVLIDGHQMAVSEVVTQQAKASNIPVVLDGGSWKPGLENVLPTVDYAICSANFTPPECHSREDVFTYLEKSGIAHIAVTNGEHAIATFNAGERKDLEIPPIKAVDTLGAGDILHGAFCHYILQQGFIEALAAAALIASDSCQYFGTRQWMQQNVKKELTEARGLENNDSDEH